MADKGIYDFQFAPKADPGNLTLILKDHQFVYIKYSTKLLLLTFMTWENKKTKKTMTIIV